MTTVKTVERRDSATSILRKIGIKPRDYNSFIKVTSDDKFAVQVSAAEKHLKDLAGPSPKEIKEKSKQEAVVEKMRSELVSEVQKGKKKKASVENYRAEHSVVNKINEGPKDGESCSSYCRRMILAGHNNAELFDALTRYLGFGRDKRAYPAWYRYHLRKQGHSV